VTSDEELVAAAAAALPTSTGFHTVSAALRDAEGHVHTGVNLFHFTGGPCAEMVALANAVGCRPVRIVAVGDGERGVMAPCGRCRQIMLDLFPGIEVMLGDRVVTVEALMPDAYRWSAGEG
jgi:cytidine deaminase